MSSVIVILNFPGPRGTIDLELSDRVPLRDLIPALVRVLKLPSTDKAGQPITYQLVHQARQPLQENETLQSAGIVTGDVLSLMALW